MHFNSLGALANHLLKQGAYGYTAGIGGALKQIGAEVQKEVVNEVGVYMPGIGPYPNTERLAASTVEKKGFDIPLFETGAFKGDVGYAVNMGNYSVTIGTNQKYMKFSELGTQKEPPRPIFGPAALRVLPGLAPLVAAYTMAGLTGMSVDVFASKTVHRSL